MRHSVLFFSLAGSISMALLVSCRSPYVETTIVNSGKVKLHNIEVDYPSASFGFSSLAPGATFHYRFQIQDAGHMKVEFSDNAQHSYSGIGPYVAQGQQGTLELTLDGKGKNQWSAHLHPSVAAPKDE